MMGMGIGEIESNGHHRRASKPSKSPGVTIHGLAQSGDLASLQKKLAENPSLLNSTNAVVIQLISPAFVLFIMRRRKIPRGFLSIITDGEYAASCSGWG